MGAAYGISTPTTRTQATLLGMMFRFDRFLFGTGLATIVVTLSLSIIVLNRQLPWQDEVFTTSTAWSMVQSRIPSLSVLAQYPASSSPVKFYGPVSFEAEAALLRLFGLSLAPWRLACLAGVALTAAAGAALVRTAGGDLWSQILAALILTLIGAVSRFLPGRWDYVTMGFFLIGMLPIVRRKQDFKWPSLLSLVLGGACIAVALGSSPRSLTLLAALLVSCLVTALLFREIFKSILGGAAITCASAVVVQSVLLWPWGLTPLSWYSFVRKATQGDALNVTPLLGGRSWQLDPAHHKAALIVLMALTLIAVIGIHAALRGRRQEDRYACRLFLGIFALANLLQMLLLVGSALGRPEFMLPPMIVAALCWLDWDSLRVQRYISPAASLAGVILAALIVQYGQNVMATFLSWDRRDPAALTEFVRRAVPKGSVVYGPVGGYFYAVEQAESKYLYTYEETTQGLASEPLALIGDKLDTAICSHATYLIWPEVDSAYFPQAFAMPPPVSARLLTKIANFKQPALGTVARKILQTGAPAGNRYGYPDTAIYSLRNINQCGHTEGDGHFASVP